LGYERRTSYQQAIVPVSDWLKEQDTEAWEAAFPVLANYRWPLFDYASEDQLALRR